ncbi:hypothetical protein HHL19_35740 [Streptomyces sp. R302]|uniref:hypothetical protein n=1 Tax=unclassified Streptomyces TaxID=2593676 RepID=UPI00145CC9D0|nr:MULTISPECIES: hypothetical protein [unclassified Streptomyces]NML55107.1 hypothetical protein [Streptomyces sp. R301]NML83863.1 hypothetical protein [Streptomyces sp. R302]
MPAKSPLAAFETAVEHARTVGGKVLALVAATLHAQFPAGACLVLTRSREDGETRLFPHSIRDAEGVVLRDFEEESNHGGGSVLGGVPPELADRWGARDPASLSEVVEVLEAVEALAPYACFGFLPDALRTPEEVEREGRGWPTPLWLPLAPLS